MSDSRWLDTLLARNSAFRARINPASLPVARTPGRVGLITCMDPRINLEGIGIDPFRPGGECDSDVRVIRTIGGIPEDRSLIVGIHLAGIREFAIVMHTDCGNCLAKQRISVIAENLQRNLSAPAYHHLRDRIGEPWPDSLIEYLRAFDEPTKAVVRAATELRDNPIVPQDTIIHGLVYTLTTATLDVVVDGYRTAAGGGSN